MAFPVGSRFRSVRILVVAVGISAFAWSTFAIRTYRAEAAFTNPAFRILAGDRFGPEQLIALSLQIEAVPVGSLRPAALSDIATIRLRLAEVAVQSGRPQLAASAFDNLEAAVAVALEGNPANPFMWLTDYWIRSMRGGNPANALTSLGMSYDEGPNEGWVAVRRNPVALSAFSLLPDKLAGDALNEFARLVGSGFYREAADTVAGAGWPIRDKLLAKLTAINEGDRRRFAKILDLKDLGDLVIPGLNK